MTSYKWLLLALVTSHAFAADQQKKLSDMPPLERGKVLRKMADEGNAEAMMFLADLILNNAPKAQLGTRVCDGKPVVPGTRPEPGAKCTTEYDPAYLAAREAWKPIGLPSDVQMWWERAAERGNKIAITTLCRIAKDELAPRAMRVENEKWCDKVSPKD